ncbi:MAG: cyclic nucleotide-binding domain-containing protein [Akkermansiaceae bacterium]|nr:cyclic nucleotide-binding domain-containing protein [Akkermansiaceae bacterium]
MMSMTAVLKDLSAFAFFGGIEPEALASVADLFEEGSYPAGTRVIEEGSRGNRLYIITAGQAEVRIRRDAPDDAGLENVLTTLGRGETFGEIELLDTQERSASVVAVEAATTLELTNRGLYEIFRRRPDIFRMIMMNLARDLSRRLRHADRQLASARLGQ